LLEKVGSSFRLAALGTGATSVVLFGARFVAAGRLLTSASFGAGAVVEGDWSCDWDGNNRHIWNCVNRRSWNGIERCSGSGGWIDGGLRKQRAMVKHDVGACHRHGTAAGWTGAGGAMAGAPSGMNTGAGLVTMGHSQW
jgi:hypothetical protein